MVHAAESAHTNTLPLLIAYCTSTPLSRYLLERAVNGCGISCSFAASLYNNKNRFSHNQVQLIAKELSQQSRSALSCALQSALFMPRGARIILIAGINDSATRNA
jgi:hypothetical protein